MQRLQLRSTSTSMQADLFIFHYTEAQGFLYWRLLNMCRWAGWSELSLFPFVKMSLFIVSWLILADWSAKLRSNGKSATNQCFITKDTNGWCHQEVTSHNVCLLCPLFRKMPMKEIIKACCSHYCWQDCKCMKNALENLEKIKKFFLNINTAHLTLIC